MRESRMAGVLSRWKARGVNSVELVLTAVAFTFLRRLGLIADTPLWAYLALLAFGGLVNVQSVRRWGIDCTDRQLHYRVASTIAATAAVIYATGYGPTLAIGYMFIVTDGLKHFGSRVTRPFLVWCTVSIGLGQAAIAAGVAPSLVPTPAIHGLGLLAALGLAFAIHTAGTTTAEKERAQAELRRSEERFRSLVQNASDAVAVVDLAGNVLYVSPSATRAIGHSPEVILAGPSFTHPDDVARATEAFSEAIASPGVVVSVEMRVLHPDGTYRWQDVRFTNLCHDPSVEGIVVNFHDITDRKAFEAELARFAYTDRLTGLHNRAGFGDRLEHATARSARHGLTTALVFLDLDRFKVINDSLGHDVGDEVLVAVAERLRTCVRAEDSIARFGGDEFTILLEDTSADRAAEVAERVTASLRRPIDVRGRRLTVTASVGLVVAPDGAAVADDMLRDADLAMYLAKERGRSRWELFDAEMGSGIVDRYRLEAELARAIEREELVVHFQPEVSMLSGEIVGFEALVRWAHPDRGLLLPGAFIALAEESDLIVAIDRFVLADACAQLAEWQATTGGATGANGLVVSVNVSSRSLAAENVSGLLDIIGASDADPRRLQLEITERVALAESDSADSALAALRERGVRIAIDDFGTGYSSLACLQRFTVDALKVDRSFVAELGTSAAALAIVRTVAALGRSLDLRVTAEGTETWEQVECLRALGCDSAQGYWFGRPVPAAEATALLGTPVAAESTT